MILSGCFFIVVFLWSRYYPPFPFLFRYHKKRNSVITLIFQFFNFKIF